MVNSLKFELDRVAGESEVVVYLGHNGVDVQYVGLSSERLFERLVLKHEYWRVPFIASRICGLCSHAHFWASNLALESALGIEVDDSTAKLRDACNKLQIVENNLIHLAFLALPDYRRPTSEVVRSVLKVRKTVTNALDLISGRLSNPPPYAPGGFVADVGRWRIERAIRLINEVIPAVDSLVEYFISSIALHDLRDPSPHYLALALWPEKSVPVGEPYELLSSEGRVDVSVDNYGDLFVEGVREYSRARECTLGGRTFFVGARARMLARDASSTYIDPAVLESIKLNPYGNLLAKAFEIRTTIRNVEHNLRDCLDKRPRKVDPVRKKGRGLAIVEAPRGLLLHYYEVCDGIVEKADIITPTVMFTRHIETSAKALVSSLIESGRVADVPRYVEMLVRAYDPCIPCAVHVVRAG